MANYYGKIKSNRFAVNNIDEIAKLLDRMGFNVDKTENKLLFWADTECATFEIYEPVEDRHDIDDEAIRSKLDLSKTIDEIIQDNLKEGEHCIVQEVGSEKFRDFVGNVTVITSTGMATRGLDDTADFLLKQLQ